MVNGLGYSNSVGVQELVMQPLFTHSIIQLIDFYYLVFNYKYVFIYNKLCKNMAGLSLCVLVSMLQTIYKISIHAVLSKFTFL
jgi:hypothetical protein